MIAGEIYHIKANECVHRENAQIPLRFLSCKEEGSPWELPECSQFKLLFCWLSPAWTSLGIPLRNDLLALCWWLSERTMKAIRWPCLSVFTHSNSCLQGQVWNVPEWSNARSTRQSRSWRRDKVFCARPEASKGAMTTIYRTSSIWIPGLHSDS